MEIRYDTQYMMGHMQYLHVWTCRITRGGDSYQLSYMCDEQHLRRDNPAHESRVNLAASEFLRLEEGGRENEQIRNTT